MTAKNLMTAKTISLLLCLILPFVYLLPLDLDSDLVLRNITYTSSNAIATAQVEGLVNQCHHGKTIECKDLQYSVSSCDGEYIADAPCEEDCICGQKIRSQYILISTFYGNSSCGDESDIDILMVRDRFCFSENEYYVKFNAKDDQLERSTFRDPHCQEQIEDGKRYYQFEQCYSDEETVSFSFYNTTALFKDGTSKIISSSFVSMTFQGVFLFIAVAIAL